VPLQLSATERLVQTRQRYVARGVATTPLVVARAEGARIEDVDGRSYIDFAGGLGCQNAGHGLPAAVAAIHEQADRYLHQCFMVGLYEPYLEVCRRLAELSPCAGRDQRSLLVGSGAEAVENAVKIARAATGRPAVVVFENAFHGRTLLTMTMTNKLTYKRGFGPFAPEVYRAPGPYPYRDVTSDDAIRGLEQLFARDVDPAAVACVVLEPVQGEGGFIPMPDDFPARLLELCARHGILYVDDEVQTGVGRTGRVWAIEHYRVAPDLLVAGKSLGGGLPLASVTGRAEVMDAVDPGGLGGTFGGNPLACAAAVAALDEVRAEPFLARAAEIGETIRDALDGIAGRVAGVGEVRGLGPMLALELVEDRASKTPAPGLAKATTQAALERGLVLLSCGFHGNVVRILVPLVIDDEDLARGLEILEESLGDASAAAA
jgi:4-aminobutyrate aminotransferase / (S)-3-amino-2-methylpropionate transaminase / 5-aminovalerate transaminase